MRQQFTLGIHSHGTLVGASLIGLEIETEGVQVALVLDKREWQYLVDGDVIGWIVVENHKLQANCVLQPLLVDGVGDGLRLTSNTVLPVSYTHLTLPTIAAECRSRWSPYH